MRLVRFISYLFLLLFLNVKAFAFTDPNHVDDFDFSASETISTTVKFSPDGKTMFVIGVSSDTLRQYSLGTAFDLSSSPTLVDSKFIRTIQNAAQDIEFNSDGTIIYIIGTDGDDIDQWTLSSPYDISTCSLASETENLDNGVFTVGSNAGDFAYPEAMNNLDKHRLQGVEINNDGTKLFLIFMDTESDTVNGRLYEFNLTTPYDVSTLSIVTSAGIALGTATQTGVDNPAGMRFSPNGKRLIITSHHHLGIQRVMQISLSKGFDTSSFTIDGSRILGGAGLEMSETNTQTRGAAFSGSGLKVYIGSDRTQNNDEVYEYDLVCPFNIIDGVECEAMTEGDRIGMAEAQMELARRTIDHSTNSALNRLKWIRRNKDKQDLTNLQIDISFSNQMLASLTEAVKAAATKKNKPFNANFRKIIVSTIKEIKT